MEATAIGGCLAEAGARVCVLAKGVGSTHLAPGSIDVLGYGPERVESPAAALRTLGAAELLLLAPVAANILAMLAVCVSSC